MGQADSSLEAEGELPGGWKCGEAVYFASVGHTLRSGDRLQYGDRGIVSGPAKVRDGQDGRRVAVRFPHNTSSVACFVDVLARAPPPKVFGGSWCVGDTAVFTGAPQPAHGLAPGMAGEVVGPAPIGERGVTLLFPGQAVPVVTASVTHNNKPWLGCAAWCGNCSRELVENVYTTGDAMVSGQQCEAMKDTSNSPTTMHVVLSISTPEARMRRSSRETLHASF